MSDPEAVEFISEQVYGWIGNLMRDLDAKGTPVSLDDVAEALDNVLQDIDQHPAKEAFDEFLKDLNDGRGTE